MFQKFTKIIEIKSRSKFAQPVLSLIAFCESIFFPIPPDTILIPIIYFNKKKYKFNRSALKDIGTTAFHRSPQHEIPKMTPSLDPDPANTLKSARQNETV